MSIYFEKMPERTYNSTITELGLPEKLAERLSSNSYAALKEPRTRMGCPSTLRYMTSPTFLRSAQGERQNHMNTKRPAHHICLSSEQSNAQSPGEAYQARWQ